MGDVGRRRAISSRFDPGGAPRPAQWHLAGWPVYVPRYMRRPRPAPMGLAPDTAQWLVPPQGLEP